MSALVSTLPTEERWQCPEDSVVVGDMTSVFRRKVSAERKHCDSYNGAREAVWSLARPVSSARRT